MILIKNNALKIIPVADLVHHHHLKEDIFNLIEEYVLENKFEHYYLEHHYLPLTGMAKDHHSRLMDYLKQHLFNKWHHHIEMKN